MDKTKEGYLKLFSMARTNIVKARFIISNISPTNHDISALLEYQTVGDKFVVSMSKEILLSLPKESFNYKMLYKYLAAKNQKVLKYERGLYQYFQDGELVHQFGQIREPKEINTMRQEDRPISSSRPRPLPYPITTQIAS